MRENLLTLQEAARWASQWASKQITPENISYLIQYGRIEKLRRNKQIFVKKEELKSYYESYYHNRASSFYEAGVDKNLAFDHLKESDTTKHVHRLHPYKGKFIPQLAAHFITQYFHANQVILDPFCGSGTALVQSSENHLHAIGVDISAFNTLIANVKVSLPDLLQLKYRIDEISLKLKQYTASQNIAAFDEVLKQKLSAFNSTHFPSPSYKREVNLGRIDGKVFGAQKLNEFLPLYESLLRKYAFSFPLEGESFLDTWYVPPVREALRFTLSEIENTSDPLIKQVLYVVLSRVSRSCRATTHADLSTLKAPVKTVYYCAKHGKICKPLFSILKWWCFYAKDSLRRLALFQKLRSSTFQYCLQGDSRTLDMIAALDTQHPQLAQIVRQKKIQGIFSSPPYVGMINYHEQHAYAYELFGLQRQDHLEIGPLFKGKGKAARETYVQSISEVLSHCKKYLVKEYDVFLVANDKDHLYSDIAQKAGMQIVNEYKRPVINRAERGPSLYRESIFHLKAKT